MAKKLFCPRCLGLTGAIIFGSGMLILSLLAKLGLYLNAAEQMQKWHVFYSLTPKGILVGVIEASIWGFIVLFAFGWVYNKLKK